MEDDKKNQYLSKKDKLKEKLKLKKQRQEKQQQQQLIGKKNQNLSPGIRTIEPNISNKKSVNQRNPSLRNINQNAKVKNEFQRRKTPFNNSSRNPNFKTQNADTRQYVHPQEVRKVHDNRNLKPKREKNIVPPPQNALKKSFVPNNKPGGTNEIPSAAPRPINLKRPITRISEQKNIVSGSKKTSNTSSNNQEPSLLNNNALQNSEEKKQKTVTSRVSFLKRLPLKNSQTVEKKSTDSQVSQNSGKVMNEPTKVVKKGSIGRKRPGHPSIKRGNSILRPKPTGNKESSNLNTQSQINSPNQNSKAVKKQKIDNGLKEINKIEVLEHYKEPEYLKRNRVQIEAWMKEFEDTSSNTSSEEISLGGDSVSDFLEKLDEFVVPYIEDCKDDFEV